MAKWTLSDGIDTHTFAINPNDKSGPAGETDDELNVGDGFISSDGPMLTVLQRKAATSQFQVVILTEDEYRALWTWYDNEALLTLTDDLANVQTIYMTNIEPRRTRKASHPWFHDLTVSYLVIV